MLSKVKSSKMLNKINSELQELPPALQKSIKKVIEKEHFTEYEVRVKDLDTGCDNFLDKLYGVDIKGVTPESEKEINLFLKEKVAFEKLKLVNLERLFENEEIMYNEIAKIMETLQDKAGVPIEDRFKIAKAYDETDSNLIILENLCKKGFRTYGKGEPMSLKFVQLSVQELAKFHALSFVIEAQMPEYFKTKIAVLDNIYNFDEDWQGLLRNVCNYVANLYDNVIKKKIEDFIPILFEKLPKYETDKTNICTLLHGDYKKNNVMFRMVDGELVEVLPIDYQILNFGCPIRDLLYFIFTGTDQEFRRNHLNDIKELYFTTLSRFLKYFDMDVESVYPREKFEKIYTEWLDYGLMMSLFAAITVFAPDTGVDFGNQTLAEMPFYPDKKYNYMLRGLVDDFIDWGYL